MMNELRAAREALERLCGGEDAASVLCAVSGGLDSMCLLHLLSVWGQERNAAVTAAHFNHQLRGAASDEDERFVGDWCAAHGISLVCGRGDVRALAAEKGWTLEEAAREARYAFLTEQQRVLGCTCVLTAHHADDHAETMLLNLLRGTGIRGLTGIPEKRDSILRPFLQITKKELTAYAENHGIPHREDATNELDDASRNVLRHKVLPVLRELNPRAVENMVRTAELLAADDAALSAEAEAALAMCRLEEDRAEFPASGCLGLNQAVLGRVILSGMAHVCGRRKDLTHTHVQAVCDLLCGGAGREVSLPYGMTARRDADALVILRRGEAPAAVSIRIGERVALGRWEVALSGKGGDRAIRLLPDAALQVTLWRPDDRMTLPGSRGARSLKRLCAEQGISPAERDLLPVLRVNGRAAAVPKIGMDVEFMPQRSDAAMYVTFHEKTEEREP